MQRIRELAVQSANGTVENRAGLQAEVDQLTQEISRIIDTTQFNGTNLLSGSNTLTFQVGVDGVSNAQIQVSTTDLTTSQTSVTSTAATSIVNAIITAFEPPLFGGQFDIGSIIAIFFGINDFRNQANAAGVSSVTFSLGFAGSNTEIFGYTPGSNTALDAAYATIQAAITYYNGAGGVLGGATKAGVVAAAQAQANTYNTALNSYNSNLSGTSTIDISSQNAASAALASIEADINQISTTRATFGATQNRFEAAIANIQNYSENLSAARSRIMDADFATETTQLTRTMILQQIGVAVLSQAQNTRSMVRSLL